MTAARPYLPSTSDVAATMTDDDVVAFCRNGYVVLPAVVPEATNRRAIDLAERHPELFPGVALTEPWFVHEVLLEARAAGVARSLLGRDFALPRLMVNHRLRCPTPQRGNWHVDGGSRWGPEVMDLQVFYLPQDTPLELGPTELVPGSHLVPATARAMGHYDGIRGAISIAGPAGSIVVTAYRIWHRAGHATGNGVRNLFKYCYSRSCEPRRDWIPSDGFDLSRVDFTGPAAPLGEQFHECFSAAAMFTWLSGRHEHFRTVGGQGWPVPGPRLGRPYGFPAGLEPLAGASGRTSGS